MSANAFKVIAKRTVRVLGENGVMSRYDIDYCTNGFIFVIDMVTHHDAARWRSDSKWKLYPEDGRPDVPQFILDEALNNRPSET